MVLLYKAALWGCEHGMKILYLGGGVGSGEDSLFKFKRAFYKGDDLLFMAFIALKFPGFNGERDVSIE